MLCILLLHAVQVSTLSRLTAYYLLLTTHYLLLTRFPHWVDAHEGERYSVIWFMDNVDDHIPKTTAIFSDTVDPIE